ncbi:tRNA1(Val) (adenine(37)-N6)-methyltransferase [Kordiimonas sp. SCSIO 12610]|uniref:tRNA1(Val) (adenine(37)-N6)-methyltransferase n=1 Tax=Kordiimonas sp. SCSIO 12610 TaxID=2829597 RepID=UPI002109FD81|nr:methyltransferase domain-containing protein [Kordiimonas sp. SCSIO 12610]UTW56442.1 methyltransferase domain-containing protein [Kordiimonas sp. SCSIO 12610]
MAENETIDNFLDGSVRLIQPKDGYRVSMDTVLLAASVPAKSGDHVLEGGIGSAGASLCLARRVEGVSVTGIEIQDEMVALAEKNIVLNGLEDSVLVQKASIKDLSGPQSRYDHVMINPPYLPEGKAIRPPDDNKGQAHMDLNATLKDWIRFCVHYAKQKGTITIVYRADRMDEVISHLYGRVGDLIIMPFWPRAGRKAKRVIIQGRKGVSGAVSLLPGLALHGEEERYTSAAEEILRKGKALDLKGFARSL